MQITMRQRKWPKRRSEWPEKKWTPSRTWSRGPDDLVISSLSDFDPPSLSSITKSMGIFPFKQLMYRWQKLSQSSCTYRYKWKQGGGKKNKNHKGSSQRVDKCIQNSYWHGKPLPMAFSDSYRTHPEWEITLLPLKIEISQKIDTDKTTHGLHRIQHPC